MTQPKGKCIECNNDVIQQSKSFYDYKGDYCYFGVCSTCGLQQMVNLGKLEGMRYRYDDKRDLVIVRKAI